MLDTQYGMKYPFPHTLVHIVDNSAFTGELPLVVADDPSMYGTLVVSGFPMGEDGKVIPITRSDILNVAYGLGSIGTAEIKKYGQTITYPLNLIDQGAPIQLLRVTPSDATYAYSCITIEWSWSREEYTLHVRYGEERLPNDRELVNYQNKDRLAAAIKKAVKLDYEDTNGVEWHRRAFMVNVSAGRGSAYNDFTTAINQVVQAKRPANAQYLFTTINTKTNLTVEQFFASLVNINNHRDDAIDPVNVVIGKRALGSSIVVPYFNEEAVVELYNEYMKNFKELLNDPSYTSTDYEQDVARILTINTFDPIFGLYLYGGTDVNAKLPHFQVDMRSADIPLLPESNHVYYNNGEDPEAKVSQKLLNLTTGITNPLDSVLIGDMYLSGGDTSYTNPYIYIVVGINQYSGAVTTVKANTMHFRSAQYDTNSRLATVIDASEETQFIDILTKRINKGYATDGDTVAWYDTSRNTWELYFITTGSKDLVLAGTYATTLKNDASARAAILPSYSENDVYIPGYSFIAWDTMTNIGNLIGIVKTGDPSVTTAAVNRAGATCIDIAKPFDVDDETSSNAIWVNSGYYEATVPPVMIKYMVAKRTAAAIKKHLDPPMTVTLDAKDVVGTQFDAFECSQEKAAAYTIKDGVDNITFTSATAPKVTAPDNRDIFLGWKPEGTNLFRFIVSNTSGTTYKLTEATDSEISAKFHDDITTENLTIPVAFKIFNGYLSEYQLVETEPVDWATTFATYFTKDATGSFVPVGVPVFDTSKYYWTTETGGTSTQTKPADWDTTYSDYWVSDDAEGDTRTAVTAVETAWAANTFYSKNAKPEFYSSPTFIASTKYDRTADVNKWSAFKDISTAAPKYYNINGSEEYAELTGITSDTQFMRWYYESPNGAFIILDELGTDDTAAGGYSVTIPIADFEYIADARAAERITRYTVISTIGSLYRIQENALSPQANYYSSSYGINITSVDGGVKLAEGYTGFFDDTTDEIEYKWNYSGLLVKAFRGLIDPRIMSPNRVPAKYMFDGGWNTVVGQSALPTITYTAADLIGASTIFTEDEKEEVLLNPDHVAGWQTTNADIDVKQAMYDLMIYRVYQGIPEDKRPVGPGSGISLHLDAGVTDTSMANLINNSFVKRFDNPNASFDIGGWVSSTDGIAYTYVKRIADNLFRHCQEYSVNKPFVNTYTKIDRSEYVSYFPDIDTTDWDYREVLYNSGGNAWIPDVNGSIMRRSQRTLMRGSDTSDLIQESNMRTLTQLVYLLQNKLDEKLFEYNDDSLLRTMQDEVNNMFTNWVGNLVDGLDISFDRDINPVDGGEVIVCYVNVVFRGINLRIPVIVNINRRLTAT